MKYVELYFIHQSNMSILLNSKSMEKEHIFTFSNDDINLLFPDDPNLGDTCLVALDIQSKKKWFIGKNMWQDFDFDRINKNEFVGLIKHNSPNTHYLFTSSNNNYEKITDTYDYLFGFCNQHNLPITEIIEIFPTETPRSNDDEIVVDIYLAIGREIPKTLLKQYLPFRIHRRKYNFFTY